MWIILSTVSHIVSLFLLIPFLRNLRNFDIQPKESETRISRQKLFARCPAHKSAMPCVSFSRRMMNVLQRERARRVMEKIRIFVSKNLRRRRAWCVRTKNLNKREDILNYKSIKMEILKSLFLLVCDQNENDFRVHKSTLLGINWLSSSDFQPK